MSGSYKKDRLWQLQQTTIGHRAAAGEQLGKRHAYSTYHALTKAVNPASDKDSI